MRGTPSVLGAISSFAHQSGSRIPHLKCHLHARHSRPKNLRPRSTHHAPEEKHFHNQAYRKSWRGAGDASYNDVVQAGTFSAADLSSVSCTNSPIAQDEVVTYQSRVSEFQQILEEGHPDRVLHALLDPSISHDFIRNADDDTFAAVFTSLDPKYFIDPYKEVYHFMKPSLSADSTYRWVRPIEERLESFATQLDRIVGMRRDTGHNPDLNVYRHLLNCARAIGDGKIAEHVFESLMPNDGIEPDLLSYNHFMEAVIWSRAWTKSEQWRLRVYPRILLLRRRQKRPRDLQGHQVTTPGKQQGLRYNMLLHFKQLVAQGFTGDEATFTNLMTAMGREGDMTGVRSILKSVYNIDVDLLLAIDEEELETPTFYEEDSPLRPTSRLLFTIAHIFSTNNEIATALKLVDFISRNYNIPIPYDVWVHLYQWAFVLQLKRYGAQRKQGMDIGKVPPEVLDGLWDVMTDVPHNIQPNIALLMLKARAKWEHFKHKDALDLVRTARLKLDQKREETFALQNEVLEMITDHSRSSNAGKILSAEFFDLRRKFIIASLRLDCDIQLVSVFIRRLLSTDQTLNNKGERRDPREHEHRFLPSMVKEFAEYLPNVLVYETESGVIGIQGKLTRNTSLNDIWAGQTMINGIIRAAIDTDHHNQLVEDLKMLPTRLEEVANYCWVCESRSHRTQDCTAPRRETISFEDGSSVDIDDMVLNIKRTGSHPIFLQKRNQYNKINKPQRKPSNSSRGEMEATSSVTTPVAAFDFTSSAPGKGVSTGISALGELEQLAGKGGKQKQSGRKGKAKGASGVDELEALAGSIVRPQT